MLELLRPAWLAAGAAAALVPLVLHFIVRGPPAPAPLPTARFLRAEPGPRVRVRRRPSDLLLLALRMALPLLLGAALAEPRLYPSARTRWEIVLLDRSLARDPAAWRAAVSAARARLLEPSGVPRGALVLFDSTARVLAPRDLTARRLDSLGTAADAAPASGYAAALRALPNAARSLGRTGRARATLVSSLTWGGWSPGLPVLRAAAWPGALTLMLVPTRRGDRPDVAPAARGTARVLARAGEGTYVSAALGAAGWRVAIRADTAAPRLVVLLRPPAADTARRLLTSVRDGATLVVTAAARTAVLDSVLPWTVDGAGAPAGGGDLWLGDGRRIAGAVARVPGRPVPGARTVAVWDDARAAAAARRAGRGCVVFLAADAERGRLRFDPGFPALLDALARACAPSSAAATDAVPLDAGALRLLRGRGEASVSVARASAGAEAAGTPLGRWLWLAALAVAGVEAVLAYGRRRA